MKTTAFRTDIKARIGNHKTGTKSVNNIIWGHLTVDAIERFSLKDLNWFTLEDFEKEMKLEMKPVELNDGVSVDELWNSIYEVNKNFIDNYFSMPLHKDRIKSLLAGLTIPISIERDTLQK